MPRASAVPHSGGALCDILTLPRKGNRHREVLISTGGSFAPGTAEPPLSAHSGASISKLASGYPSVEMLHNKKGLILKRIHPGEAVHRNDFAEQAVTECECASLRFRSEEPRRRKFHSQARADALKGRGGWPVDSKRNNCLGREIRGRELFHLPV